MNQPHKFPITVYYADTDAGGVVYHARYLEFFERARFEMFTEIQKSLPIFTKDKGGYVVSGVSIQYRFPARLGDHLEIETQIQEFRRASLEVQQKAILNSDGKVVCEGLISLVHVNGNFKPEKIPDGIRTLLTQTS